MRKEYVAELEFYSDEIQERLRAWEAFRCSEQGWSDAMQWLSDPGMRLTDLLYRAAVDGHDFSNWGDTFRLIRAGIRVRPA